MGGRVIGVERVSVFMMKMSFMKKIIFIKVKRINSDRIKPDSRLMVVVGLFICLLEECYCFIIRILYVCLIIACQDLCRYLF